MSENSELLDVLEKLYEQGHIDAGHGIDNSGLATLKALEKIEALIASKVEEARENAFAGGFGAGGGEVHNLELAWKLYNEALQSKEGDS